MASTSSPANGSKSTGVPFVIYPAGGGREVSLYVRTKRHYLDLDHFISRKWQKRLRRGIQDRSNCLKVTLVMPTQDSEAYIGKTLQAVIAQIRHTQQAHPGWDIELIIAVNGVNQESTSARVRRLQRAAASEHVPVTVFIMEGISGKVKAMNASAAYAKKKQSDIVGFIDDDIVLSNQAISRIVEFLIDYEEAFLVGPHRYPSGKPLPSKGLFARLEYELRREEQHPTGACLFLLTDTYAPLPDNIILDDEALKYYYALPDDHVDPFIRMKLVPRTKVFFRLVGNQRLFWLRRVRLKMGAEQLAAIFGKTKSRVRQVRLAKSRPFWRQPFFAALPIKYKCYMGIYFFYYRARLSVVHAFVHLKIALRRARGRYPYQTKWYGANKTPG